MTGDESADLNISDSWRRWRQRVDLAEYNQRWARLAAQGHAVHGEADLVCSLGGQRVLDAGCGAGRVAIELAVRGKAVIGVDNDPDMVALARANRSDLHWVLADLSVVELDERFDVVVLAGDVLTFVVPGAEPAVVANMARHLAPGGRLVVGGGVTNDRWLASYDRWAADAGLVAVTRLATWDGDPYDGGPYAVSIHRLDGRPAR